ncbi:MAG TPA: 6-carboxytetrahydropterin synthase [Planctomycetota bacterium]|nr:6-carboxytetrahydropterin synthase [Planctomycetota bacterium]
MSSPTLFITHQSEFAAAHRLHNQDLSEGENARLYGPCNNPTGHGHNYDLLVTVAGPIPPRTGMVMDLNCLAALVREELISRVDHKNLNSDVPFLAGLITTAENMCVVFWEHLSPLIEDFEGCRLHRIRLYENRSSFVDYHGPLS